MVSDQELASCVETLLRQAGPTVSAANISVPGLVRHLEAQLGLDLSHKEPFIRNQVAFLLSPPPPPLPKDQRFVNVNPAAAAAAFQQYQYYHQQQQQQQQQQQYPGMSVGVGAGSGSGYPSQQGVSFKYQAAAEMVGAAAAAAAAATATATTATGTAKVSAAPVKAKVEPSQENVKGAGGGGAAPGTKESAPAKRKGGPGGLNKVCGVSPELQAIVGQPTMARTEIVKQLWAYIRKNNLQDPNNKRKIICNDELRLVFETDCTDMFKMNKLLSKHIISLSDPSKAKPVAKKQKAALSGDVVSFDNSGLDKYPIMISDDLAQFFGTGERKMLRDEALGRVWDHIKSNHLEDPRNAMVILCDSKLKQLFGCESVSALGISELLSRHCFTQS